MRQDAVATNGSMSASTAGDAGGFESTTLLDVHLEERVPAIEAPSQAGRYGRRVRSIIWLHDRPLGFVDLAIPNEGLGAEHHAAELWRALGPEIRAHLDADGLARAHSHRSGDRSRPSTTVPGSPPCAEGERAVRERRGRHAGPSGQLSRCLVTLLELDYPSFEILIIDNAPASGATRRLVSERFGDHAGVRYIREGRPGLAAAHNRGIAEARGAFIAFTDDDVSAHPLWLLELARCFGLSEDVGCVTGMILPAELETPAQVWAESYWALGKGFGERRFDLVRHRPEGSLFPFTAGVFGSGANMAFRSDVLRELGGFDPAIGTGTAARGGDDLAAFFRLITAGYQLVYSPPRSFGTGTLVNMPRSNSRPMGTVSA